jgi:hypothetical protein
MWIDGSYLIKGVVILIPNKGDRFLISNRSPLGSLYKIQDKTFAIKQKEFLPFIIKPNYIVFVRGKK